MNVEKIKFFKNMVKLVASNSKCLSRKVGTVIVRDNQFIISTGYNGPCKKQPHCITCLRHESKSGENLQHCVGVHSEQNAIINAAKFGISVKDCDLITTTCPCSICTKMIINSEIKNVYYFEDYNDGLNKSLQKDNGITNFVKMELQNE